MKPLSPKSELTPEERSFGEFMQRGDDFFKIELWRPAKKWYNKALELNTDSARAQNKIADCDRLMTYELRIIRIFAVIAATAVSACIIFC